MAKISEDVLRGSHSFYADFVQRDFLGTLTPGYIVLLAVGWGLGWSLGVIAPYPAYLGILLALVSLGAAYLTGVAIRTVGRRLGLILEYPFSETSEEARRRLTLFQQKHAPASPEYAQRERCAAVARASGNGAAAVLLAALVLSLSSGAPPVPLWLAWLSGILLLLAHWESVYAQQSFELGALGRPRDRGIVATFFSQSLLYGLVGLLGRALSSVELPGLKRRPRRRRRKVAA